MKGNASVAEGTAIATFVKDGYSGHAAIYESQDDKGIHVYDQWITGAGKAIGPRLIKWDGTGVANNGAGYYVIKLVAWMPGRRSCRLRIRPCASKDFGRLPRTTP